MAPESTDPVVVAIANGLAGVADADGHLGVSEVRTIEAALAATSTSPGLKAGLATVIAMARRAEQGGLTTASQDLLQIAQRAMVEAESQSDAPSTPQTGQDWMAGIGRRKG